MKREGDSGVTLLEVLVALVIVAVIASVSVLSLGPRDDTDARNEAKRLVARLSLAVDEALSTGLPLRFEHETDRYSFTRYDAQTREWRGEEHSFLALRRLPRGLSFDGAGIHVIGTDASGGAFTMHVRGASEAWRVRFDGLSAVSESDT